MIKIDWKVAFDVMRRFEEWARNGKKRHGDTIVGWSSKSDLPLRLHATFAIPKYLDDKFFVRQQSGHLDRVVIETPWGKRQTVHILFTAKLPDRHSGEAYLNKKFSYIEIYYPYNSTWKEVLEPASLNSLKATLLHELTHAVDWPKRSKKDVEISTNKPWSEHTISNLRGYYNSPREVRAYLRSVYEDVVSKIGMEVLLDRTNKPASHFIQKALEKSPRWQKLDQHLTQENKKYVLKNLYQELERVVFRVKRESALEKADRIEQAFRDRAVSSSVTRHPASSTEQIAIMTATVDALVKRIDLLGGPGLIPRSYFERLAKRNETLILSQALLGKTSDQIAEKVSRS
jgi:hypothetical protein